MMTPNVIVNLVSARKVYGMHRHVFWVSCVNFCMSFCFYTGPKIFSGRYRFYVPYLALADDIIEAND